MHWTRGVRGRSSAFDVRGVIEQAPLSSILKSVTTSTASMARTDGKAKWNQILFQTTPELWRPPPPGRPRSTWLGIIADDLSSFNMGLLEARDAA